MEQIITKIINYLNKCPNQEKFLEYLREIDFELMPYENLIAIFESEPEKDLSEKFKEWSFSIRKMREFNLYDGRIFFVFKMYGKKLNKIYYFLEGDKSMVKVKLPWKDMADINFRKMEITLAFPMCLDYVERRQWRTEYHRHKKMPGKYTLSIFYLKFLPMIMELSSGLEANKKI